MKRFHDQGRYESEFLREISVQCPKCQQAANILADDFHGRAKEVRLTCTHCGYNERWRPGTWRGPSVGHVRRRCGMCGRWLEKTLTGPRHPNETRLTCPGCAWEMLEPVQWRPSTRPGPRDPYFGYPLWFTGSVRGHGFWAYNRANLAFIKSLVAADIRIREPNRNRSLASRLPAWLLAAKNRTRVIKEITRMEKRSSR